MISIALIMMKMAGTCIYTCALLASHPRTATVGTNYVVDLFCEYMTHIPWSGPSNQ